MRVLQLSVTEVAGMPYRLMRALEAASVPCRMVTIQRGLFPFDILEPTWEQLGRLASEADVVHYHGVTTFRLLQPRVLARAVVVHIHGDPDRGKGIHLEVPHVVATPDLLQDFHRALFVPNLILPHDLPASPTLGPGPLRVFKSPSYHMKHQVMFASLMRPIVQRLAGRVEYVAPARPMLHADLVRLRASCHISLDHLHGYYGLESLESLAQGLIAVNGASDETLARFRQAVGTDPPFAVAHDASSCGVLLHELTEEALCAPARFEQRRARGPRFVREHYGPDRFVQAWLSIYRQVAASAGQPWQAGGTSAEGARAHSCCNST